MKTIRRIFFTILLGILIVGCTKENKDLNNKIKLKASNFSVNGNINSNLHFENSVIMGSQGNYNGYNFLVSDMNGDGYADIIAVSPQNGRVVVWPSKGATLAIPIGNPAWMENQGNYTGYNFMLADMNGDGKSDLVAVSPQHGRAVVWVSTGTSFIIPSGNPAWMENQGDLSGCNFMVADMNGDNKSDLVAVSPQNGSAVVWTSNGKSLNISSGNHAWMENQGNYSGYNFMVADMTGDGKSDLVAVSVQNGRAVVWTSSGTNLIIPDGNPAWMENQGNFSGYNFMVADMTGDGKSDLVAVSAQNGRAVVWASSGTKLNIPNGNPAWMENQGNLSSYTFSVSSNGSDFSGNKKSDLFAINNDNAHTVVWSLKHNLWESTIQRISGTTWNNEDAQTPYLVYIPEKNKLVMELLTFTSIIDDRPANIKTVLINSVDNGNTWTERKDFPLSSYAIGLTNAGKNVLYSFGENLYPSFFKSIDGGINWKQTSNLNPDTTLAKTLATWDPALVINSSGVQKIVQIGYASIGNKKAGNYYSQPYIRSSVDSGNTWTALRKIDALKGFNEINLIVAGNGNLIAACRRDPDPVYYAGHDIEYDNYCGLSISVSKDQGQTWEQPKTLFEYGRHHPSMILLNDGHTILMTYAVRKGGCLGASDNFSDSIDGYPYYGIEAVISNDDGKTWDVNSRYVLSRWKGNIPLSEQRYFFRSSQSTSTIQLSDGTLLTSYGTGRYRTGNTSKADWFMDIDLVRWRK